MKKTILFSSILICFSFLTFELVLSQSQIFSPRGPGGGGALFFPSINPLNENEFYIACDMSEMFHSTNFGRTYSQSHFTKLMVFNRSTYEFTHNPSIAYSLHNDGNIGFPVRTNDAGANWTPLPGNPDPTGSWDAIKVNYSDSSMLFMHNWNEIWLTRNGGTSFTQIHTALSSGSGIFIAGIFVEGDSIYLGTNDGILHSTNGGVSFSLLATTGMTSGEGIFSFSGAKSGNTIRFFCTTGLTSSLYNGIMPWDYYGWPTDVYTMDLGANNWVSKNAGIGVNDFVMYTGMARNDINTLYLAGSEGTRSAPNIIKSTNAGMTWTHVFNDVNNQNITTGWSGYQGVRGWSYGETAFGIAVAPTNANKIIFGDFGFVHRSTNGGTTWDQSYVDSVDQNVANSPTPQNRSYHSIGLENTTCWQVIWSDTNNMYAGYSDIRGTRTTDAGNTWGFNYTGNSANSTYRIVKAPNGNLFAATSDIHDMYQSTRLADAQLDANDNNGKIIYSTDMGATWQLVKNFGHPVFWVAADPNDPNTMYASVIHYGAGSGQGGIWKTNDLNNLSASTWTKLANPPRTQGHPASIVVLNDGKMVCTYSGRRGPAFTNSSGCFIYNPIGNSWTDVSDPGMHYWTKDIVIDPADTTQSTWYVCVFSGWGGAPNGLGGLYRTTNRGTTWSRITGTQFDRVTSITFNPTNFDEVYLSTEIQGLWMTQDITQSTPVFSLVSAYPFRQPERMFFNPYNPLELWVSSFGNGLKVGTSIITGIDFGKMNLSSHLFSPNPAHDFIEINQSVIGNEVKIVDVQGRVMLKFIPVEISEKVDISFLPAGIYLIQSENSVQKLIKY